MADVVTPEVRSRMMSGIRSTNTRPELIIRRGLHGIGFRYRLHAASLPGKPDLVFPRYGAVIFVHGCFWHGHDCHLFKWPSSRIDFWKQKISRNQVVDARNEAAVAEKGWRYAVVWECALKGRYRRPQTDVIRDCAGWLRSRKPHLEIRGTA
ncbi:DNA mismatch endonuclease Vsr [Bradyrhizobium sp. 190]|uniref:very short patch repair endonuclease n=1 Tax=Bradyrhizobium sp. 190 TaxID=2782658 RepID=UPI001FF72195|nr:very short patch repair endonuclease [Bradyrhizobium sp. 190]MCK1513033.1 DNA mismatch endonuclease Vsr [Bradyrhizobium sp. 190]